MYTDEICRRTSLVKRKDSSFVNQELVNFANWCSNKYLILNIKKVKELVIDFGRTIYEHKTLIINSEEIETTVKK